MIPKTKIHYWVGVTGFRTTPTPAKPSNHECNLKYIGWTNDFGWPKTMSTGRVFHKPSNKGFKKQRRRRKELLKLSNN